MRYTYNPALINDKSLNEIRFELGDVLVGEGARDAYLSDEEIMAALTGSSYKRAKMRLIESLLARFSYEVDTKIHEAEWKLSERVEQWRALYTRLKAESDVEESATSFGFVGIKQRGAVFTVGMHDVS